MKEFKYKGIIFDLDGTILDTINDITDGLNGACDKCGLTHFTNEDAKYLAGSGVDVLVQRCLAKKNASIDLFDSFKKNYLESYEKCRANKTKVFDGLLEVLDELKENGIKMAVFSNKPDCDTQAIIKNYFKEGYFDIVLGKKDGVRIKPYPEGSYPILENFGLPKEEILYAGDTSVDMDTATNIGLDSIGVLWGFIKEDELREHGAKFIISNPKEILKIFEKGSL